jgi:hypothetical protein
MTDLSKVKIRSALVKIIGIFESKRGINKLEKQFLTAGYNRVLLSDQGIRFHRNYWYPEYRNIWFNNSNEAMRFLTKNCNHMLNFKYKDSIFEVQVKSFEIHLMPNGLHFFSIIADSADKTAAGYSNLLNLIRSFDSVIAYQGEWVKWIEKNCLDDIQISIDKDHPMVKTDVYSGSKFKIYSVFDLDQQLDATERLQLLYELGTVSKISQNEDFNPLGNSKRYVSQLMLNRISVFNNYEILPLLDSFTVLGHCVLNDSDPNTYNNYNETYFRIYLHALLLKYNLFRYQSEFHMDNLRLRDTFEKFLNSYNLSHISYNFLPNLIYNKVKLAIELDEEMEKFKQRIVSLNESIKEEQQKKTNLLLGFLGLISSVGSALPIFNFFEKFRLNTNINAFLFYGLAALLTLSIGLLIIRYIFPEKIRLLLRKFKKKNY